jgi:hypothetical protein
LNHGSVQRSLYNLEKIFAGICFRCEFRPEGTDKFEDATIEAQRQNMTSVPTGETVWSFGC